MKLVIGCFVFLLTAVPALAQTPSNQIPDTVFGDEEKRIITDYLSKKLGLPDATANPASGEAKDRENDDEKEGRKSKVKGKNKKQKKARKPGKGKNKQMPPGLAKRKELPPGLARRHTLPPGLAVRELPAELEQQLPPPVEGSQRIIADDNIVLIEQATGRILDVILGGK